MKLALGTVQFGLAYGVAGPGAPVPEPEVRRILALAASYGIDCLDTAPGYGDIEPRLAALAGDHGFRIISKILPLSPDLSDAAAADTVRRGIGLSIQRLGKRLQGVMFHQQEDLKGPRAKAVWDAASEAVSGHGIALGVSCYGPDTLLEIADRFRVTLAQLPGNALDQRVGTLRADGALAGAEVHLRSAFLQGLLLQEPSSIADRLPGAVPALTRWRAWCAARALAPLEAALGLVKGFAAGGASPVSHCVVGVDNATHLEQIWQAWCAAQPLGAPELAELDPAIIDPRRWARTADQGAAPAPPGKVAA